MFLMRKQVPDSASGSSYSSIQNLILRLQQVDIKASGFPLTVYPEFSIQPFDKFNKKANRKGILKTQNMSDGHNQILFSNLSP